MKPRLIQPIVIQLKPSPLLLGLLGVISMMCCVILAQLPVSFTIKLALITLVIVSTIYLILRDVLLRLPQSWQSLEVNSQGQLKLTNRQGQQLLSKLVGDTFIHRFLIILNFERSNFKLGLPPLILLANLENHQQHRQLRIYLRWAHQLSAQSSDADNIFGDS